MVKATRRAHTETRLKELIEEYFDNYHPAGYGTSLDRTYVETGEDGEPVWVAELSRLSSCD